MQFCKNKIIFLLGSALFGFSLLANADDLKISNDSLWDLSFDINYTCSEEFGIVGSHSMKVIPEKSFNKACQYNPTKCVVKVYDTNNCFGKQIATIVFDTRYGVQSIHPTGITTKANGFNLFFEGPWIIK